MSTRWKPYPRYKDSGVEWLGRIPEHWGLHTLKHRAALFGGGTPSKENLEYWAGDIPWVSPKDMKNDLVTDSEEHITSQAVQASATRMVPSQSVLLVVRSGILKHTIPVALNSLPVALNQDMKAIVPKSGLGSGYLAWFLRGLQNRLLLEWRKAGATVESLEHDLIARTRLPLPDTSEQQSITSFLDRETAKIDALVAKKERLIELLQEKRTAFISHAVTQGLNPNAPMKDSGIPWLGRIPAHWRISRLATVCRFEQGKAHEPYFDDAGEFICVNARFISTEGASVKHCRVNLTPAKRNDVLMVMSDLPNGRALAKAYIVDDARQYAVNQRVCRLTATKAHPRYLFYQLNRSEFFLQHDDGVNQTHLHNGLFTKFPAVLPTPEEQDAIAAYLDAETAKLDALTAKVRTAIERLREYRAALISAAVTGQIDVRQVFARPDSA